MSHWVFGYGSLIYKADFPYLARMPAYIEGWERRFWQGSHDHRGTPDSPGRVVTLIQAAGARCGGMAYCISEDVFDHLDHREKNGYRRVDTPMNLADGRQVRATVYIAAENNHAFLGPASLPDIAEHIRGSHGPSGANRDYLLRLAQVLRELDIVDDHVFELEQLLR
jgi:cation transport protein ChaC